MGDSDSDTNEGPRTPPVRANPRPPQFSSNGVVRGAIHVDPALAPKPPGRPRGTASARSAAPPQSAKGKEKLDPRETQPTLPVSPVDSEDDLYGAPPKPREAVSEAVRVARQVRSQIDDALDEGEREEYSEGEILAVFASGIITGITLAYLGFRGFKLLETMITNAGKAAAAVPK